MDSEHQAGSPAIGRAAGLHPANRFESVYQEADLSQLASDDDLLSGQHRMPTEFLPDASRTIIRENDSPDVPFRYSVNPYRGCEHGCAYCYARPSHETLGLDAGLDFETKILVKRDAPDLLRRELGRSSWQGEPLMLSGVTDCYQPAERKLGLTRRCLEVMLESRQPATIVTKNALVLRDLDILVPMAQRRLIAVALSVTTLDADLARRLEPRTSTPEARLRAIGELSTAGVPVGVMVAPIIPGLNDEEIPAILHAASEAGAKSASFILLRLPFAVRPIFEDWLARCEPLKRERIEALIRATRGGRMNDPRLGSRMRGEGPYAEQIAKTFRVFAKRYNLNRELAKLDSTQFRPPRSPSGQMHMF